MNNTLLRHTVAEEMLQAVIEVINSFVGGPT